MLPPHSLPGSPGDPGTLLDPARGGSLPTPSPPLAPPAPLPAQCTPLPEAPRPGDGRRGAARRPAVAGTPASAAAKTPPLTSIAEQSARGSQGRSHVEAEREHSRGGLRRPRIPAAAARSAGPQHRAQGAPPPPPPDLARVSPASPRRAATFTTRLGGGARRSHAPRREPAQPQPRPQVQGCARGPRPPPPPPQVRALMSR